MMSSFIIKEGTEELQSPPILDPPFLSNHMSPILLKTHINPGYSDIMVYEI